MPTYGTDGVIEASILVTIFPFQGRSKFSIIPGISPETFLLGVESMARSKK
jgi:hypothetical protein